MGEPRSRKPRARKYDPFVVCDEKSTKRVARIAASQELIAENARRLLEHLREQAANQPIEDMSRPTRREAE
ncbi:MAG: hypothetical protein RDU25_05890 [Patescibacteria group bacterium]|nr:hypothetical protein [Patescibacteria group bacterium]